MIQDIYSVYKNALRVCVDVQKKAFGVVTGGAQSLVKTEVDAAKDVFAAARASFDKARSDGVRQVANKPQAYLPDSRERIVTAYQETIDLLVKTSNELSALVTDGYKSVLDGFKPKKADAKKPAPSKTAAKPAARKTASKRTASANSNSAAASN
ncbi:MAG: phasin family protein [Salinisphaera sp.]|nr:phasin family protein [Salinisphaera sp.]MDN5938026.1 phasin family protein [Salinisphaera sp.]